MSKRVIARKVAAHLSNLASLIRVLDIMKFTGTEIADLMNDLRAGFQEGYLQAPAIKSWPLERSVEAYESVEKGGAPTRHVLIPGTTEQP